MLRLSDNSIKKVMQIVNNQKDAESLCRLRRSCFRMNQVAIQNSFNKIKDTMFGLKLETKWERNLINVANVQLKAYIGKQTYSTILVTEEFANLVRGRMVTREAFESLIRKHIPVVKVYKVSPNTNINQLIGFAFNEALQKVPTINGLHLTGLTLNTEVLQVLEQYAFSFSASEKVTIEGCTIDWTEAELMKFLQLFEGLKYFCISGKFKEPIVTDEHLSLVSGKISIINGRADVLHFPGITSRICDYWLENKTDIHLLGISTEISFSAIHELATKLNETVLEKEHKKTNITNRLNQLSRRLNFGVLEYSNHKTESRKFLLAQRERNAEWKIIKLDSIDDFFQVYPKNGCYSYEFRMERPYEEPDFPKLLDQLNQLRANIEADEDVIVDEHNILRAIRLIGYQLQSYKKYHNLSAAPFENQRPQDVPIRRENEMDEDEALHGLGFVRRMMLADINNYERLIRYRTEQLDAPVAE